MRNGVESREVRWNRVEGHGLRLNGVEWSAMACTRLERNRNRVECSGVENAMEWNEMGWNRLECNDMGWTLADLIAVDWNGAET